MARGVPIDRNLTQQDIETFALEIVEDIKRSVPDDHYLYAFVCGTHRVLEEAWASLSSRGNGTRLICDAYGGNVTPKEMKENYGWVVVKDLYTSTNAVNVNAMEKKVHELMFADPRSIWLKNGMGGVKLDKDEDGNINVLKFSLNIIHGPRKDLTFAADQRHKSKLPAIEHNGDDWFLSPTLPTVVTYSVMLMTSSTRRLTVGN